jgi:hypothetical protein
MRNFGLPGAGNSPNGAWNLRKTAVRKSSRKYLKIGNEEEIGKTMSPAKAQRREEKFRNSNFEIRI